MGMWVLYRLENIFNRDPIGATMKENPTKQVEINKALWANESVRRSLYFLSGTHILSLDVYCGGEFAETTHRTFCRISRQWAVKYETRMHRIFLRNERFAIEVDDRYAFKYTGTGAFPAESVGG